MFIIKIPGGGVFFLLFNCCPDFLVESFANVIYDLLHTGSHFAIISAMPCCVDMRSRSVAMHEIFVGKFGSQEGSLHW